MIPDLNLSETMPDRFDASPIRTRNRPCRMDPKTFFARVMLQPSATSRGISPRAQHPHTKRTTNASNTFNTNSKLLSDSHSVDYGWNSHHIDLEVPCGEPNNTYRMRSRHCPDCQSIILNNCYVCVSRNCDNRSIAHVHRGSDCNKAAVACCAAASAVP